MNLPRLLGRVGLVLASRGPGCALSPRTAPPPAAKPLPYEVEFREICGDRWPRRWAQSKVESAFNPRAVSPVGAKGLLQAMPKTWLWYVDMGWIDAGAFPFDPRPAINGGDHHMTWLEAYYHRDQRKAWGAFNAGQGTVNRAVRLAGSLGLMGRDAWMRALPQISGKNAAETLAYIPRIERAELLTEMK